jgi:hypothetical protein
MAYVVIAFIHPDFGWKALFAEAIFLFQDYQYFIQMCSSIKHREDCFFELQIIFYLLKTKDALLAPTVKNEFD